MAPESPEQRPDVEKLAEFLPVRRALFSVTNKKGVAKFAEALNGEGIEIISTGGTATEIASLNTPVTPVQDVTGFPEMLDGRVKTLDPHLYAGILADTRKPEHLETLAEHHLEGIQLVCVNLYEFEETLEKTSAPAEIVEKIDIGGPSMLRAAAKNHPSVLSLCNPDRYGQVMDEITEHGGISVKTRVESAIEVFERTAAYEAAIYAWMREHPDELIQSARQA